MNEQIWETIEKQASTMIIDKDDHFGMKPGWNMKKVKRILKEHGVTVDDFIAFAKKKRTEGK